MNTQRGHKGFTLVEILIVLAVLAVLAVVVVPNLGGILGRGKARAYQADQRAIQAAVDDYYGASTRFLGQHQYPIYGEGKGTGTYYVADADAIAAAVTIAGNPLGGTVGGSPNWTDDGNGVRDAAEESLNDEDGAASSAWHVVAVTRGGKTYQVDTRDYIIDMAKLVPAYLKQLPGSASKDNDATGTGSYTWYVKADGTVGSLLYYLPTSGSTGFKSGVYP